MRELQLAQYRQLLRMPDRQEEIAEARERSSPSAAIVYEAIRREGETELLRSNGQLFWSALAAGLSMGFSLLTEALLHESLPDNEWKPLLVKLGYSVGFIAVILGRQQLFTENTLTPVLPVLSGPTKSRFAQLGRLWTVVLIGNMAGAFIYALALATVPVLDEEGRKAALEVSSYVAAGGFWSNFSRAIVAGWLVALLVWVLPFAEAARFFVIVTLTYIIGLGEFPHIIAGSVKAFMLLLTGEAGFAQLLPRAFLPVLIGNTIGGVALVAMINHGQVSTQDDGQEE